jgi:hypothetical protein
VKFVEDVVKVTWTIEFAFLNQVEFFWKLQLLHAKKVAFVKHFNLLFANFQFLRK